MSAHLTPLGRDPWRAHLMRALEAKVETILSQARPTGQFGTDPWIVRDQDGILTLAQVYLSEGSPHSHHPAILEHIAAGGRWLRERQDEKGMYPFDKKDGSNWGPIYMPWTYLRWMITYQLMADHLAPADREIWAEGLQLGYRGIADTELNSQSLIYPGPLTGHPPLKPGEVIPWIHNIPCHHATGLFLAGQLFDRSSWQQQSRDYMQLVVAEQSEHGWWTEHSGPVVLYNRVYVEALGLYYALSGDEAVLPAIIRGNRFHLNYVYPNGAMIETIDERNPYPPLLVLTDQTGAVRHDPKSVNVHPGLYFSDEGRALLAHQLPIIATRHAAELDGAEFLLLCLPNSDDAFTFTSAPEPRFRMGDDSLIVREDPWLLSFSAYCCPRTPNRFIQDRQNFVSVYHRDLGLIFGGGNTKLQPRWSTLTVGDPDLITPIGAKRDTNLAPDVAVTYTPDACHLAETAPNRWTQQITSAGAVAELAFEIQGPHSLQIHARLITPARDGRPANVHLTFIRYAESPVVLSDGSSRALEAEAWDVSGVESVAHHGWIMSFPAAATLRWPVFPHNPYTADGHAETEEGRLVLSLPLSAEPSRLTLSVAR